MARDRVASVRRSGFRSRALGAPLALALAGGALGIGTRAVRAQDPPAPEKSLDDTTYDQIVDPKVGIDIEKMLQIWASKLKILIVPDPQITGLKIKFLSSDVPLTWGIFKKILDFNEIILDERQVHDRWIMFAHLKRNAAPKIGPPFPIVGKDEPLPQHEEVVTAIVQITNGAGADIFGNLRQLQGRDQTRIGSFLYVRGPEYILIQDFASNVEYYTRIIRALDQPGPGQQTKVYDVQFAPAEDVGRVLQSLGRSSGGATPQAIVPAPGGSNATAPTIIADPRTNKLIIQAATHQFPELEHMLKELDVRTPVKPPRFHVYKCKYVDAEYLAGKLSELFSGQHSGGGSTGRRSSTSPSGGAGGAAGGSRAGGAGGGAAGVTLGQPGAQGAGSGKGDFTAIETRVVPDELANSLLIQAEDTTYKQILALLEGSSDMGQGLDHPRRRVLIEGQIWEISTPADDLTIGFELGAVQNPAAGKFRPSGITDFGLSTVNVDTTNQTITRIPNLSQGLTAVLTKDTFDKLPIIMNAVATLERSRQIATPFCLTNDNQEATFTIDDKIPYQTSTIAGVGIAQSNVQTIDVKTELKMTPQVNSDDNLTLDVSIELGTIGAQGQAGLPPTTNTRTYSGVVTIPSMKYVVFGGLESEQNGEIETKVPWLGDIPILGHVFKQKQWTHSMSKVYVFMRATIFSDDKGLEALSKDLRRKAHVEAQRDTWLPPIVADRLVKAPWKTVQDSAFDVFGTGSGNPFPVGPIDD